MVLPNPEIVEVATADGVTLRCRRYPRPGARAVVCGHGLCSCGYEFDLPLRGFRISEILERLGYEVWVMNFRGGGHPPWKSDGGDWRHTADHLGAHDLPAVIGEAARVSGAPVFYLGHSLGGMSAYMYLQGAVMDGGDYRTVRCDAAEAARRNEMVAGAVTAGSAVSMSPETEDWWMERLRRHPLTQRVFVRLERYLLRREVDRPRLPVGDWSIGVGFRHPLVAGLVMNSPLMSMYMVARNMGFNAARLFGIWGGGDASLREIVQTLQVIRRGEMATLTTADGEEPAYSYASGMGNITTTMVTGAGTKDFMEPHHIKYGVLDAISSKAKRMVSLQGKGHVDLLYHLPYREIFEFLEENAR